MIHKLFLLALWILMSVTIAGAASSQDSKGLIHTYDAYNVASKTGNVEKILSFYPAQYRKDVRRDIAKKENRKAFILYSVAQVPESYEVQHIAWSTNKRKATLYLLSQFAAMPEIQRPRLRMEETVVMAKEKGRWKIDSTTLLADPETIKRPQDLAFSRDEVNREKESEISGRIVRTEVMKDHTLVILRTSNEEHAVFLPPSDILREANTSPDSFKPWTMHTFWGNPHKNEPLKFFANGGQRIDN